jgi:hypothetical protein
MCILISSTTFRWKHSPWQILTKLEFYDGLSKNTQISNFMKIRPVAVELFHADGQMDGHDEANSRLSQFCERA